MELQYKSFDGRYTAKFSGTDVKDVFAQIASFEEIFCANTVCRNCENTDCRLSVRNVEGNNYYERICNKCGFSFSFGQKKSGGSLFPKYTKGKGGWSKWVPSEQEDESVPAKKAAKK